MELEQAQAPKSRKNTYIIAALFLIGLIALVYFLFIFKKSPAKTQAEEETEGEILPIEQVDIKDRPFVTLTPTLDGAEIIISVENMSTFDRIEYELSYQSDNPQQAGQKISRGATGSIGNTKEQKSKISALLGTASRGTRSVDKGITDGILKLHLFRGEKEYVSETPWDLIQLSTTKDMVKSRDENMVIDTPGFEKEYWVILAQTVGIPQGGSFQLQDVALPVYGAFSIAPEFKTPQKLSLKTKEGLASPKLFSYNHTESTWEEIESKYDSASGKFTSETPSFSTFVIASSK